MGTTLIFVGLRVSDGFRLLCALIGLCMRGKGFQETAPALKTVPETDTGGQVEYTKALERTMLKELGNLPS